MEEVHASHDSLVQACDRDGGGLKIVVGIEADRAIQWVHSKIPGIAVSPTQHDGKEGVPCILVWIGTPLARTCGCPCAGRLGGGDGDGPAS